MTNKKAARTLSFSDYSTFDNLLELYMYRLTQKKEVIRTAFKINSPNVYVEFLSHIRNKQTEDKCLYEYIADNEILLVANPPELSTLFEISFCHYWIARSLNSRTEQDLIEKTARLNDAHYYLGMIDGICINLELLNESKKILKQRAKAAAKGGSSAKGFNKMTAQIKQLLVDLKPENGWRNKSDAARKIAEVFFNDPEYPGKKTSDREEDIGRITQHVKNKLSDRKSDLPSVFEKYKYPINGKQ